MDKAIVFSINNDYSFALANVLMSLKDNSECIYNTSDFIVYHDGVSDNNQQLLKKICKNINFINFTQESKLPVEIYNHPHMNKWGKFIYQKLNCFELVSRYEHVLWLDADILISGDISDIFTCNTDMAWRNVVAWKHKDIYKDKEHIADFPCCHAGVIYFNKSITNKVSYNDILNSYNTVKDGIKGGIDERILTHIAFSKKFNIKSLPIEYNSWLTYRNIDNAKIIHFVDNIEPKPWKNSIVYAAFPEWGHYYKQWIKMGGTGPLANQDKFYSRRYTFGFLRNSSIFTQIIKNLDIVKNTHIYTNFDFSKAFYQFYIHGIPQDIHYEILSSGAGGVFKVCLHIENKRFISNHIINVLEGAHYNISQLLNETSLEKDSYLKLEIVASENMINLAMNILIMHTLDKILNFFSSK